MLQWEPLLYEASQQLPAAWEFVKNIYSLYVEVISNV